MTTTKWALSILAWVASLVAVWGVCRLDDEAWRDAAVVACLHACETQTADRIDRLLVRIIASGLPEGNP